MSSVSDPVGDFLTRLRNGVRAGKAWIETPSSRMLREVARILKEEGFVKDWSEVREGSRSCLKVSLKYVDGHSVITDLKRVSRPGLRRYVGSCEIPRVKSGVGISIISSSSGVMSSREARRKNVGGELVAFVW